MEIVKQYDGNTIIVLLTSNIGYSTINVSKKDGSVVFHPGINESFNCFEKTHWEPVDLFTVSTGEEKQQGIVIGDIVLGRCNNRQSVQLEPMKVSDIMTHSKSIYCEGIWTDGSAMKLIASNVPGYYSTFRELLRFDYRDMGGEQKYHLLFDEEIKTYLDFLNKR